jgi:hypothetical protein
MLPMGVAVLCYLSSRVHDVSADPFQCFMDEFCRCVLQSLADRNQENAVSSALRGIVAAFA